MLECMLIIIWTMNLSYGDYEWQWFVNLQASLLAQTQSAEEAKQACAAAQTQNEELIRKLGDAEKKVDQLQESVQRFVTKLINRKHLDIFCLIRSTALNVWRTWGSYTTYFCWFYLFPLLSIFYHMWLLPGWNHRNSFSLSWHSLLTFPL